PGAVDHEHLAVDVRVDPDRSQGVDQVSQQERGFLGTCRHEHRTNGSTPGRFRRCSAFVPSRTENDGCRGSAIAILVPPVSETAHSRHEKPSGRPAATDYSPSSPSTGTGQYRS